MRRAIATTREKGKPRLFIRAQVTCDKLLPGRGLRLESTPGKSAMGWGRRILAEKFVCVPTFGFP
ncbi:hypothetical protein SPHV1_190040 [Novosphingobium sp. KN65.2]|nr:hypothetical protein SPHV1_190040 [Novosphingobium sp. KN65.2]